MAQLFKSLCTILALTFIAFGELNLSDLDDISPITPKDLTSPIKENSDDDFYRQLEDDKTENPAGESEFKAKIKALDSLESISDQKNGLSPIKEITEDKTEIINEDPKEKEIKSKAKEYTNRVKTDNESEIKIDERYDSDFMNEVAGLGKSTEKSASTSESATSKTPIKRSSNNQENNSDNNESSWAFYIFSIITLISIIFLIFWYQTQMKKKFANSGIPIEVLGQSFIDGGTKILLLKVGAKVLVLAKSNQFCTTIDTITDPNEVNMLTLGSGAQANGEDFSQVLNQMAVPQMAKNQAQDIPNEKEIREELSELKSRLGNLK